MQEWSFFSPLENYLVEVIFLSCSSNGKLVWRLWNEYLNFPCMFFLLLKILNGLLPYFITTLDYFCEDCTNWARHSQTFRSHQKKNEILWGTHLQCASELSSSSNSGRHLEYCKRWLMQTIRQCGFKSVGSLIHAVVKYIRWVTTLTTLKHGTKSVSFIWPRFCLHIIWLR